MPSGTMQPIGERCRAIEAHNQIADSAFTVPRGRRRVHVSGEGALICLHELR